MTKIPRKIDYTQLWKAREAEKAPKKSIISALQKLLNEKEDEIIHLNAQIEGLKERIAEFNDVMEQMEQQFIQQQNRIKELEAALASGGGGYASYAPSTPVQSEGESETIRKLQNQLREMENKLYIFSNLPSRITELENRLVEKDKEIEKYITQIEKLKETIRKLNEDGSAAGVIEELQNKIKEQEEYIKKLEARKTEGVFEDDVFSEGTSNLLNEENRDLREQVASLLREKNDLEYQINLLNERNRELQEKLMKAEATINELKLNPASALQTSSAFTPSPSTTSDDELYRLKMENRTLKLKIEELENKLQQERLRIEEIVEKVQKGSKEDPQEKIKELTEQLNHAHAEIQRLQRELKEKEAFFEGLSGGDLISNLNLKIEKLKSKNKKLEMELEKLKKEKVSLPGSPRLGVPQLKPTAPKIRSIDGGSNEKVKELNLKVNQLEKQVAEKDAQLAKLNKELLETQTELAKLKAAGPTMDANANIMTLLQDLQLKIRKLKEQIRKKDARIAELESKLG